MRDWWSLIFMCEYFAIFVFTSLFWEGSQHWENTRNWTLAFSDQGLESVDSLMASFYIIKLLFCRSSNTLRHPEQITNRSRILSTLCRFVCPSSWKVVECQRTSFMETFPPERDQLPIHTYVRISENIALYRPHALWLQAHLAAQWSDERTNDCTERMCWISAVVIAQ